VLASQGVGLAAGEAGGVDGKYEVVSSVGAGARPALENFGRRCGSVSDDGMLRSGSESLLVGVRCCCAECKDWYLLGVVWVGF